MAVRRSGLPKKSNGGGRPLLWCAGILLTMPETASAAAVILGGEQDVQLGGALPRVGRRFHRRSIRIEAGTPLPVSHGDRSPPMFQRGLRCILGEDLQVDVILVWSLHRFPALRFAAMRRLLDPTGRSTLPRGVQAPGVHRCIYPGQAHGWITREFYRPWRIVGRVWRHLWHHLRWAYLHAGGGRSAFYGRTVRWLHRVVGSAKEMAATRVPPGGMRFNAFWRTSPQNLRRQPSLKGPP